MKRVGVYVRVSTDDQNLGNQVQVLTDVARQRDWQIVEVYSDQGISGAKSKDSRPGFRKLCKDASQGKFDMVACWAVDRLSRSLQDLVSFFGEMAAINVGLYIHQQAVDSTTPAGKAMLQMSGVFAEFERAMLLERINAGIARARRAGKAFGRPTVGPQIEAAIRSHRAAGLGIHKTARLVGVGVSVVQRMEAVHGNEQSLSIQPQAD
jgi:DNA invertase Pin-like site-specific DNA recombinase